MKKITIIILTTTIIILGVFILLFSFGYLNTENISQEIMGLFPDGGDDIDTNNGATDDNTNNTDQFPSQNEGDNGRVVSKTSRFTQIFNGAVSGYTVTKKNGAGVVRFIEKERGHIYDYNEATGELVKVSNQIMTGINEVVWSNDGNTFITRGYSEETDSIKNTLVSFDKKSASSNFYTFTQIRKVGETGDDILFLQKTLNANNATQISVSGLGSPGNETNYFGASTKEALKKFQLQEKLPETGILDEKTILKLNEINKFLFGEQNENITETPLSTKDLGNISGIAKNENNNVFYIKQAGTQAEGYKNSIDFKSPLQIFKSPISNWIVEWPNKNIITLQTKSSGASYGYLYFLNTTTGIVSNILKDSYGLATKTNRNGDMVLYSVTDSRGKNLSTFVFDTTKNKNTNIQIKTLAEKCVWGIENAQFVFCAVPEVIGGGILPDSWYQGKEKFNDQFWMIDIIENSGTLLFENERRSLSEDIDAQDVSLGYDEGALYFINKRDSSLWSLSLGE